MFIEIPGSFRVVEALPADEKHVKQSLAEADAVAYPGYHCYVTQEKKFYRYLIVNENDLIRQEVAYIDAANFATIAQLAAKADAATVTAALAEKADATHHHNAVYATIESVAAKADTSSVNAALDTKANSTDVITAIAQKLNTTDAANTYATKQEVSVITGTDPELVVTPEDLTDLQTTLEGQISQKADAGHNHDSEYVNSADHANDLAVMDSLKADKTHNHDSKYANYYHAHDGAYRSKDLPINANDILADSDKRFVGLFQYNLLNIFTEEDYLNNEVIIKSRDITKDNLSSLIIHSPNQTININIIQPPTIYALTINILNFFVHNNANYCKIPKGYVLPINYYLQSNGWPFSLTLKASRAGDGGGVYSQTLITRSHSSGSSYTINSKYLFVWDGNEWRQLLS